MEDITSPNVLADNTASAPVVEITVEPSIADNTDSAPVKVEPVEQTTEAEGSEPSKAVKELIAQRKKRQEAEKEASYWRGVAEARGTVEPPKVTAPPIQDRAPTTDDFDTYEDYEVAREQYIITKAKQEVLREMQHQQVAVQQKTVTDTFWGSVEKIEESDPYIRTTIERVAQQVSPVVADLVVQSDMGIDLVRWLDSHQKETQRIASLPPLLAAKALGAIESQLKLTPKPAPPKTVSQAPEPISTVTPVGGSIIDEDKMPMDQWMKRRNKEAHRR